MITRLMPIERRYVDITLRCYAYWCASLSHACAIDDIATLSASNQLHSAPLMLFFRYWDAFIWCQRALYKMPRRWLPPLFTPARDYIMIYTAAIIKMPCHINAAMLRCSRLRYVRYYFSWLLLISSFRHFSLILIITLLLLRYFSICHDARCAW